VRLVGSIGLGNDGEHVRTVLSALNGLDGNTDRQAIRVFMLRIKKLSLHLLNVACLERGMELTRPAGIAVWPFYVSAPLVIPVAVVHTRHDAPSV
jgi:hypothetical protein